MVSNFLIISIFGFSLAGQFSLLRAAPLADDVLIVETTSGRIGNSSESIDLSQFGESLFGDPDQKATAEAVDKYDGSTTNANPEELGSYVEGDLLVPKDLLRNGLISQSSRWPNGVVPIEIRGQFSDNEMAILGNAFDEYHRKTCIRFVQRTNQADYVSIVSGRSGCWSSVGKIGGRQEVNLQSPGCFSQKGTAIHELMHALGFFHEQNRHERDSYVQIKYENIYSQTLSNFAKASRTTTSGFGVAYDYGSVMHYSPYAFSKNNRPTIVAIQNTGERMGQRRGFSSKDIQKINAMYRCDSSGAGVGAGPVQGSATSSFIQGFLSGLGIRN